PPAAAGASASAGASGAAAAAAADAEGGGAAAGGGAGAGAGAGAVPDAEASGVLAAAKSPSNMFGAAGSGSAARGAGLVPAPLRDDADGVPPVAPAAGLDGGGVLTLLIDRGAGRSARRFFVSGSSIERPSFSTCSASAARSLSSSSAGSIVTCTIPLTGTLPL